MAMVQASKQEMITIRIFVKTQAHKRNKSEWNTAIRTSLALQ